MPGDRLFTKQGDSKEIEQELEVQDTLTALFEPANLTGKTVRFVMVNAQGAVVVSRTVTPAEPTSGHVKIILTATELATVGEYQFAWQVSPGPDASGPTTFPQDGYNTLVVERKLA